MNRCGEWNNHENATFHLGRRAGGRLLVCRLRWHTGIPGRLLQPIRQAERLWTAPDAAQSAGFTADENNNIEIYKLARPATANITSVVYREDFFFQVYPQEGTGSGFVVKPDGLILTNNHVVTGSQQLTVTLAGDKKQYKARVLGNGPAQRPGAGEDSGRPTRCRS